MRLFAGQIIAELLAGYTHSEQAGPLRGQIKNLVTFGDSYTDTVSYRTDSIYSSYSL